MRVAAVIVVAGLILLSGCNDPKKASDANFRKAVDTTLAKRPICIDVPSESLKPAGDDGKSTFPIYVAMAKPFGPQEAFKTETRPLDALVAAGLLVARTGTIEAATMFTGSHDNVAVAIYDLTDRFCTGMPEVAAIKQFTEPADAMGMKASHVTYTWRLKDPADWAKAPAMVDAFPELKQATGDANEAGTDVVLTNNGWVDVRSMR